MGINFKIHYFDFINHPFFGKESIFSHLGNSDNLKNFPIFHLKDIQNHSDSDFIDRKRLGELLINFNQAVGNKLSSHSEKAIKLDGRFIIAGQQPGLMLGPIFTFLKVVTVISLAQKLQKLSDQPLIPAFWIASEDHDIFEVNHFYLGQRKFTCDSTVEIARGKMPQVGEIPIFNSKDKLINFLIEALPNTEFKPWILDMVSASDFSSYSTFFATLIKKVFDQWELVLVDPIWLRELTSPVLARVVEWFPYVESAFNEGKQQLATYGFKPIIDKLVIFHLKEGRRRYLEIIDDTIKIEGVRYDFKRAALLIREEPQAFSPGAALRPICQDAAIPILLTVGGPTELIYLWQIDPLYKALNIRRSLIFPRISATFLEEKIAHLAKKFGIFPQKIFSVGDMLKEYPPVKDDEPYIKELILLKEELLAKIQNLPVLLDQKWLKKIEDSLSFQLGKLISKLSEIKLNEINRGKSSLEKIARAIYPEGKLQERITNIFYFLAYYGRDFVLQSINTLDPFSLNHKLVEIETRKEKME